jgi:NADP-dependent 3-hydroxy acid dehydrogenase YdfG
VEVTLVEAGTVRTELSDHISDATIRERSRQQDDAAQAEDVAAGILYTGSQPCRCRSTSCSSLWRCRKRDRS